MTMLHDDDTAAAAVAAADNTTVLRNSRISARHAILMSLAVVVALQRSRLHEPCRDESH